MNYRLFFEGVTRRKLIAAYRELTELANIHPGDDKAWKEELRQKIQNGGNSAENRKLRHWLVGLTFKTAQNLGLKVNDLPGVFNRVMDEIDDGTQRDTALLLWAGAATLAIRGSQKSKIGKRLEKSVARAALTVIGLSQERGEFRLNIGADEEVSRETDAEVRTQRGWLRMEVGMIGGGNPEVISDKVGRMDRNGVILMDYLAPTSSAYENANQHGVKLIQLRNNHPVEELRQHLHDMNISVQGNPITTEEVESRVLNMPTDSFA